MIPVCIWSPVALSIPSDLNPRFPALSNGVLISSYFLLVCEGIHMVWMCRWVHRYWFLDLCGPLLAVQLRSRSSLASGQFKARVVAYDGYWSPCWDSRRSPQSVASDL